MATLNVFTIVRIHFEHHYCTDVWVLMRISFDYNFRLSVCSADVAQQSSKQQEIYCVPLFAPELEDIMTVPYGSTTD